jgi:hypothetical protein
VFSLLVAISASCSHMTQPRPIIARCTSYGGGVVVQTYTHDFICIRADAFIRM